MDTLLLLAQDNLTVEAAEKGVDILQTIVQGGAALILAVVSVILGYVQWRSRDTNTLLEREFREKVEGLLREMLDRDREASETVGATIKAMEGFTRSNEELARRVERLEQTIERCDRK